MRSSVLALDSMSFFLLREGTVPQDGELGERLGGVGDDLRIAVLLENILEYLDGVGPVDEFGRDFVDFGHAHDCGLAHVAVGVFEAC